MTSKWATRWGLNTGELFFFHFISLDFHMVLPTAAGDLHYSSTTGNFGETLPEGSGWCWDAGSSPPGWRLIFLIWEVGNPNKRTFIPAAVTSWGFLLGGRFWIQGTGWITWITKSNYEACTFLFISKGILGGDPKIKCDVSKFGIPISSPKFISSQFVLTKLPQSFSASFLRDTFTYPY